MEQPKSTFNMTLKEVAESLIKSKNLTAEDVAKIPSIELMPVTLSKNKKKTLTYLKHHYRINTIVNRVTRSDTEYGTSLRFDMQVIDNSLFNFIIGIAKSCETLRGSDPNFALCNYVLEEYTPDGYSYSKYPNIASITNDIYTMVKDIGMTQKQVNVAFGFSAFPHNDSTGNSTTCSYYSKGPYEGIWTINSLELKPPKIKKDGTIVRAMTFGIRPTSFILKKKNKDKSLVDIYGNTIEVTECEMISDDESLEVTDVASNLGATSNPLKNNKSQIFGLDKEPQQRKTFNPYSNY